MHYSFISFLLDENEYESEHHQYEDDDANHGIQHHVERIPAFPGLASIPAIIRAALPTVALLPLHHNAVPAHSLAVHVPRGPEARPAPARVVAAPPPELALLGGVQGTVPAAGEELPAVHVPAPGLHGAAVAVADAVHVAGGRAGPVGGGRPVSPGTEAGLGDVLGVVEGEVEILGGE